MAFSTTSARDPIFYRWHSQVDNVVQSWRDQHLSRYRREDVDVGEGLEVVSISSVLRHESHELNNLLVTFMEVKDLALRDNVRIRFNRLNHARFQWKVEIRNRQRSRRRVIVRIFMAFLKTPGDPTSFTNREPMLMDKFVHNLSGDEREELVRESTENTLCMEESGLTVERLSEQAVTGDQNTWCGIPMNLYLPKSSEQGRDFLLMAFVHDVEQDVMEGLDGVQHVMCGHKDINARMDSRGFGFPFDREFDFNLHSSNSRLRSFARQEIKIVHRQNIMSGGAAGWEDLGSLQPRSTGRGTNTTGRGNDTTREEVRGNSTTVNGENPRNSSAEGTSLNTGEPTEQPSSERTTQREENMNNNSTTVNGANPRNSSAEGTSLNTGEPTEQPSSERTTQREENMNNKQPLSTTVTNQGGTTTARTRDQSRRTTTSPNLSTMGTTSQNMKTTNQNQRTTRQNANTRAPGVKPTSTERMPAKSPKAENEKGQWCEYSCMTNGFCKVKWGGVGKSGDGTCFPLSYKNGECYENIPSKCRDCHKVMEKRGEPCSRKSRKGPTRNEAKSSGPKRYDPKRYGDKKKEQEEHKSVMNKALDIEAKSSGPKRYGPKRYGDKKKEQEEHSFEMYDAVHI